MSRFRGRAFLYLDYTRGMFKGHQYIPYREVILTLHALNPMPSS